MISFQISSASAGRTQDVNERGSIDHLPPISGSRPTPFSHEYHVVEGEHDASGVITTGPVEACLPVEVDGGFSSTYGLASATPSSPGAVSIQEQSRRPGLGLVGGRAGLSSTESSKRAPELHSQSPPSQRADFKKTPKLGPVVGSGDDAAFRDDGNPLMGAGANNPGGSLSSLH